ncbi:hypothetical protein M8J77_017098 [Diaphorina citri]|nr:hypothetical protein M8J77_017098 [Diaphorina citri]
MDTITEDQMNDQQGVEIVQQTDSTNADSLSIQMSLGNIASSSATSSILRAPMLNPGLPRTPQRRSLDEVLNTRGEMLVEFMEEHGLIALNGRTPGDIPGQFTFISKVGNSVVDLVWTNMELCSDVVDLTVSADFLTSDHLPVVLNLDFKWGTENITVLDMYDTNEELICTIQYK